MSLGSSVIKKKGIPKLHNSQSEIKRIISEENCFDQEDWWYFVVLSYQGH